jgi:hypothetical protein
MPAVMTIPPTAVEGVVISATPFITYLRSEVKSISVTPSSRPIPMVIVAIAGPSTVAPLLIIAIATIAITSIYERSLSVKITVAIAYEDTLILPSIIVISVVTGWLLNASRFIGSAPFVITTLLQELTNLFLVRLTRSELLPVATTLVKSLALQCRAWAIRYSVAALTWHISALTRTQRATVDCRTRTLGGTGTSEFCVALSR